MPHIAGKPDDFDFLLGAWTVENRRLKERGAGADDWETFHATHAASKFLGGVMNVDEMVCPSKGFSGSTVRTLDVATGVWSIYWITDRKGSLEPPVHGGFDGDVGIFEGDDRDGEQPVKVRFHWTRDANQPEWRQEFSYDGGKTWELNWIMSFRRA